MRITRRYSSGRRPGKVLVFFVLLLPILLGMLGLVIDCGMMMAAHRQAQNAADAAALACAWDLVHNPSETQNNLQSIATTFVQVNNGLSNANTPTVHWPPAGGAYANVTGNTQFVEVVVTLPVTTLFAQVLSRVNGSQTVQARAVAGYEAVAGGEGVAVLDPARNPGLAVSGDGAVLIVRGRVIDNSQNSVAASINQAGGLQATSLSVVGGVDHPTYVWNASTGVPDPSILHTGVPPETDPLILLPTPTTRNGVVSSNQFPKYNNDGTWSYTSTSPQTLQFGSNDGTAASPVQVPPGIYSSIRINGSAHVNFAPGIFVLTGGNANTLDILGGNVTGTGVLFYNTGPDYNPSTGAPDSGDAAAYSPNATGNNAPTGVNQNDFGAFNISSSANVTLSPNDTPGNVFRGVLFYQRRANMRAATIAGNNGSLSLSGTIYSKWGNFQIAGGGTYNAQFIVGSISVTGGATLTINFAGSNVARANKVFLVE